MRMPEPSVDSDISRSHEDREDDGSGEVIETLDKPEYHSGWTRVQRKRARSDSSLQNKKTLSSDQREMKSIPAITTDT